MPSHQTTVILPSNNPWFDAPDVQPPDNADPCTATLAFRRTRRRHFQVAVGEEVVLGRLHSTHSIQPDIDLNEYNAMAYGVSRLHAKLRHEEYGWWLEDLASANGTWVNGERLEPYVPVSLGVKNQVIFGTFQFWLFLPTKVVSGIHVPVVETKQPMRVVNIEDDRDLQRLMAMAFKESEPNLELHQFVSGDTALPFIADNLENIDLFLIDIMLPGKLNGIEIAQQIRQMGAPGHIALTSAFAEPSSDLLTFLVAEFFPKPLHILDIIPRLASYRLNRHQMNLSMGMNAQNEMSVVDFFPQNIPDPTIPPPTAADWDAAMAERPAPATPSRQRRRKEPETGTLPIVPPSIARPRQTDQFQPIVPTAEEMATIPMPSPAHAQVSVAPPPYRPAMEFESLEVLDTPIPSSVHQQMSESAVTESSELRITPLPPERLKPVPNKGNIVQRLINRLRGL